MYGLSRFSSPFTGAGYSTYGGLDSLFDRVFGEDGGNSRSFRPQSVLPLSIWQDEDRLYVEADLPGVEEKDLDITVESGVMTIKAQRTALEGRAYLHNGRSFGRAERAVTLPSDVDSSQVEAKLSNGVLHITLPKLAESRPRKIAVKSS